MPIFKFYVEFGDIEETFEVKYSYYAGRPAKIGLPFEMCEPPEPEEIEYESFTHEATGKEYSEEEFVKLMREKSEYKNWSIKDLYDNTIDDVAIQEDIAGEMIAEDREERELYDVY